MPETSYSRLSLVSAPPQALAKAIQRLSEAEADAILHDWPFWARADQLAPAGDWSVWFLLGGRGSGKTRAGAEWVRSQARAGARRLAMVGPTAADVRDVMVEGDSGLIACCWYGDRDARGRRLGVPVYESSKRRLTFANGAIVQTFSADEPERLRGPQHEAAWCDEIAAWRYPKEAWSNLQLGLRLGTDPRAVATSTPKASKFLLDLLAEPGIAVSRSTTYDNRPNLAAKFFETTVARYAGTRLGRQELEAEILIDVSGALWRRADLDAGRRRDAPNLARIVVAIDPAAASNEGADETGNEVIYDARAANAELRAVIEALAKKAGYADLDAVLSDARAMLQA